jgi:hypothetical protein
MTPHDACQGASTDLHRCIVIPMRCRSVACTEASCRSQQLLYCMAHQNIGTLVLLPGGTVYARTLKHYLVVSVLEIRYDFLHPQRRWSSALLKNENGRAQRFHERSLHLRQHTHRSVKAVSGCLPGVPDEQHVKAVL